MTPIPPRRRRVRKTPPVVWAVVITLGLHANVVLFLLALGWLGWMGGEARPRVKPPQSVGLRSLTPEQWAQNRGEPVEDDDSAQAQRPADPREDEKPKPPHERDPDADPKGQHVAVAPGNGEEDPDAKFVAETSNKVRKETVAKDASPLFRNPSARRTTTVPDQGGGNDDRAQQAGNNGVGDDDRPQQEAAPERKLAVEIPDVKARDQVQLEQADDGSAGVAVANRTESAEIHGNSDRLRLQDGDPVAQRDGSRGRAGQVGVLNLTPSLGVLDSVEGSPVSDVVSDEVDEGEGTYLNTREWKYSSFYTRLKQRIGRTWRVREVMRERDPTGSIYGSRDRYTLLSVTLDGTGRVRDIYVMKSCGLDFLDLEAIRAFERAQPFPNPPAGLLRADATVTIQFGFLFGYERNPGLQLFRPN